MDNTYIPYIIDGVIIAIPVISIIIGRFRGFAATILPIVLTIACMIFCRIYAGPAANRASELFIHENLTKYTESQIEKKLIDNESESNLPSLVSESLIKAGINTDEIVADSLHSVSEKAASAAEKVFIIPALTCLIWFAVYILSRFAGRLLAGTAGIFLKLPVIKQANNLLGALLGALLGIIRVAVLLIIAFTVIKIADNESINLAVSHSHIIPLIADKFNIVL